MKKVVTLSILAIVCFLIYSIISDENYYLPEYDNCIIIDFRNYSNQTIEEAYIGVDDGAMTDILHSNIIKYELIKIPSNNRIIFIIDKKKADNINGKKLYFEYKGNKNYIIDQIHGEISEKIVLKVNKNIEVESIDSSMYYNSRYKTFCIKKYNEIIELL